MTTRAVGLGAAVLVVALSAVGLPDAVAAAKADDVTFRPVLADLPPPSAATQSSAEAAQAIATCDENAVMALPAIPNTAARRDDPGVCVVLAARQPAEGTTPRYLLGPAGLDASAIASAKYNFLSGQGWVVTLRFSRAGSRRWDSLAQQQFHERVAMVVEHRVMSAPMIQPGNSEFEPFDGTAVISGNFRQREARDLAALINVARRR